MSLLGFFSPLQGECHEEPPKVAIIGAGLAGLTAGYRLDLQGMNVHLYEARERVGGRVLTVQVGDSYEELGGKNLLDGGDPTYSLPLIKELGLEVQSYPMSGEILSVFAGAVKRREDLFGPFTGPGPVTLLKLRKAGKTAPNLAQVIDRCFDGKVAQLLHRVMRGWEGSESVDLAAECATGSLLELYAFLSLKKLISTLHLHDLSFLEVKGGNGKLPEALARKLEGKISFSKALTAISRADAGYRLTFADGSEEVCDYLILALPCSTLRDVAIEPGIIPDDQLRAIQTLQYGSNAKLLVPVTKGDSLPPSLCYTPNAITWLSRDEKVMTWYYGGNPGVFDAQDPSAIQSMIRRDGEDVAAYYPGFTFLPEAIGVSWINAPYSKGSYSNFAAHEYDFFNETITYKKQELRKVFRPIENRIFFAGEHTSIDAMSTMEGAIASGESAATLLSTDLQDRKKR